MKPYVLKDVNDETFAEGLILSDGRCFISFIKMDYTFVYDNIAQLMQMHCREGNATIHYDVI